MATKPVLHNHGHCIILKIDYATLAPVEAIRAYIGAVYDCYLSDTVTAAVTLDQSLHGGAQIRLALLPETRRARDAMTQQLENALARGCDAGLFGTHAEAGSFEFMTVIIVSGCISSRGMFVRHLGYNAFEDESPVFWRDYVADFILRALRP